MRHRLSALRRELRELGFAFEWLVVDESGVLSEAAGIDKKAVIEFGLILVELVGNDHLGHTYNQILKEEEKVIETKSSRTASGRG